MQLSAVARASVPGVVALREQFRLRAISDEALLLKLSSFASKSSAAALVKAYLEQKNECSICKLPMTLEPLSGGCDSWCIALSNNNSTLLANSALAHKHCVEQLNSAERAKGHRIPDLLLFQN